MPSTNLNQFRNGSTRKGNLTAAFADGICFHGMGTVVQESEQIAVGSNWK